MKGSECKSSPLSLDLYVTLVEILGAVFFSPWQWKGKGTTYSSSQVAHGAVCLVNAPSFDPQR